ncbi:MAG: DUF1569 domain-containing protein [Bacteroidota bacterium]
MDSLFEEESIAKIQERIAALAPEDCPLWGRMNAAQMLAHCTEVLRNGIGDTQLPRVWYGYLLRPLLKHRYYNDQPFKSRNLKTPASFIVTGNPSFEEEKARLLSWIHRFYERAGDGKPMGRHPILGSFTPQQWAVGQYKHLDHHLRQFGH